MKRMKRPAAILLVLLVLSFCAAAAYYGIFIKPRIVVCETASPDNQNSIVVLSYLPPYKLYADEQITIICKTHDAKVLKINTGVSNNEDRITPESGNVAVTWYENVARVVLDGSQQIPQIITVDFKDLTYTMSYISGAGTNEVLRETFAPS